MEIFICCVYVHVCGCVCVQTITFLCSALCISLNRTCLLAIHNITHSLSPHHQNHESWHNSMVERRAQFPSSSSSSYPPLPSSPSLELAFSAASWNVSMRRVRSQGRFLPRKTYSDRIEGGGGGGGGSD